MIFREAPISYFSFLFLEKANKNAYICDTGLAITDIEAYKQDYKFASISLAKSS